MELKKDKAQLLVLISSHISSDLEGLCDDIYMIHEGKVILHEEMGRLHDDYALLKLSPEQLNLKWVEFSQAEALYMPFTARHVVRHWLETGRKTEHVYGGIATGNEVRFEVLDEFK